MKLKLMAISILIGAIVVGSSIKINADLAPKIGRGESLKARVQKANYVFQGVVIKVENRLSQGTPKIPHTFVTFRVEKVLKGQVDRQFVTLRFMGGSYNDGTFLTVSELPLFDVGDRDVLFVRHNGRAACPLVTCADGRLRIIKERVFTDDGKALLLDKQGEAAVGEFQPLPEVVTNKIGNITLRNVYSNTNPQARGARDSAASTETPPQSLRQQAPLPSLQANQLELLIKNQVAQQSQISSLRSEPFAISVDSNTRFGIALPEPATPPQIATPSVEFSNFSTPAERAELEMIRKNRGNPVLPISKPKR